MKTGDTGILTTTMEKAMEWGRSNSIWPLTFGLACCAIEMMAGQKQMFQDLGVRFLEIPQGNPT